VQDVLSILFHSLEKVKNQILFRHMHLSRFFRFFGQIKLLELVGFNDIFWLLLLLGYFH